MVRVIDKEVLSSDKKHMLKGKVYLPEGAVKGLFHVVHGMTEYIGRYDAFMRKMAEFGYITFGYDHIGHGQTASKEELGYFAGNDSWRLLVDDVFLFGKEVKNEMGKALPLILMGHSMGSFIVRLTAAKYDHCDKLIIMGTGGPNPASGAGIALSGILKKLKGSHGYSDLIYSMAFGSYNKGYENPRTIYDWLSRDPTVPDAYAADPLCGFIATNGLFRDMMGGIKFITDQKNINTMNKEKPVYFMSGDADPVGENGKGVTKAYKAFCKAGLHDVFMRLYPGGRHEMLNETNKEQVYQDILAWLKEKVG